MMLTLGAAVETKRRVYQLNRGVAILEQPLLLRLVIASFPAHGQHSQDFIETVLTYTIKVLPLVGALGTTTNLAFTLDVM